MGERIVFTDSTGRHLTTQDLAGFTGRVKWEIFGGSHVPPQAVALHQQGRAAGGHGDYAHALLLFDQARALAPAWPYPVYDAAFTCLLRDETAQAEALYSEADAMAPRGFFTCKTTLDCLRRERGGELFPGFSRAFATLERLEPARKKTILEGIVARYPSFAPAWCQLAALTKDNGARLNMIERGLQGSPDADTGGLLLVMKASIIAGRGNRDMAIAILGELALSPDSTLSTEQLAKATLALLIRD